MYILFLVKQTFSNGFYFQNREVRYIKQIAFLLYANIWPILGVLW